MIKNAINDRDLLLPRLDRLAVVLDDLMPGCAELVRETIELLIKQEDLEKELKSVAELIHKKNERIKQLEGRSVK